MTDSNVGSAAGLFRDPVRALDARDRARVLAAGRHPARTGSAAELECAFLDTYQARWQLAADQIGFGFAQGKTLFWRRDILDAAGGLAVLGGEMAEDLAATKLVRARRPEGAAGAPAVSAAARARAASARSGGVSCAGRGCGGWDFPGYFAAEILTGAFLPFVGGRVAGRGGRAPGRRCWSLLWSSPGISPSSGWRARPAGRRRCARSCAWPLRDLLLPALWAVAWTGRGFEWRGNRMAVGAAPSRRGAD